VLIESDYRGYRIEVNAIPADGRFNAEVRLLRLFSRDKPRVETGHVFDARRRACRARGVYMGAALD